MSEGAADRAEQSRSMKRNEKELPTTRTAQPRRPISQYQSETNSTSAIDPSQPRRRPTPPRLRPEDATTIRRTGQTDSNIYQSTPTDSTSGTNEVESDDGGPNGIAHRTTDVADRPADRYIERRQTSTTKTGRGKAKQYQKRYIP